MSDKKDEFKALIDKEESEATYQTYLEDNREFIPIDFLFHHGLHHSLVFTKYPVQEDYKTDFMYLSKNSGEWRAILVEIEKPSSKIFKDGTNEFHNDYIHAKSQILDWKAKLASHNAKEVFKNGLSSMLGHMGDNEISFKFILVMGRRAEYKNSKERRKKIELDLGDDIRFLTYDSLLDTDKGRAPAFLAKKIKGRVHLIDFDGVAFTAQSLLQWIEPHHLFITKKVKETFLSFCKLNQMPAFGSVHEQRFEDQKQKLIDGINLIHEKER